MTITIFLSDTDAHAQHEVVAFIEREALANPALNGADIRIERGDYTCVDGADELIGAQVMADVQRIIAGIDAF